MHKRRPRFNSFDTRVYFRPYLCPNKDKLFGIYLCSAEVCSVPFVILCYICRMKAFINISRYNSIFLLKSGICNTALYYVESWKQVYLPKVQWSIWDREGKFRPKRIHLFWAFGSLIFVFFFKRLNHEEDP